MTVPSNTLWTSPLRLPLRLAVRPFTDRTLQEQVTAIQGAPQEITITPGAMYILSNLAGRRVPDSVRWVLADSLHEILSGQLLTEYPERQDFLAPTFGEMFGALLLALELNGQVEIIRLLDGNLGTTPDFLVLQNTDDGEIVHLLECKGFAEDANNVRERGTLDICQSVRSFRTSGKQQLDNVNWSGVKTGARLTVRPASAQFGLGKVASSKNLSVVCIPDARIPKLIDLTTVIVSARRWCRGRGVNCAGCIQDSAGRSHGNVIGTLYRESLTKRAISSGLRRFLEEYRRSQRALWSGDTSGFSEYMDHLTAGLAKPLDVDPFDSNSIRDSTMLMAAELYAQAGLQEMDLSHIDAGYLLQAGMPESTNAKLNQFAAEFEKRERRSTKQLDFDSLDSGILFDTDRGQQRFDFIRQSVHQFQVGGSASTDRQRGVSVVRLNVNDSSEKAYESLRDMVDKTIGQIRGYQSPLDWRTEYAERGNTRFEMGVSWDKYPYPHPTDSQRLGITAWVSRDGRAEIVIRSLTSMPVQA